MVFAASRGGLIAILLVVGLLYFSGAGGWMWARIENLGDNCYAAAARIGPMANPVCEGVAKGVAALGNVGTSLHDKIESLKERIGLPSSLDSLMALNERFKENIGSLVSPQDQLSQLIGKGPDSMAGSSLKDKFQQAVDSFAIGRLYMKDSSTASQAVPWLQRGATQPEGFGVMSQLTLGSMYAQGGQGVPQNPQIAEAYLQQAKQSITLLSGSNSAQSQQLLQSLPGAPRDLQQQIDQAIRQLRLKK